MAYPSYPWLVTSSSDGDGGVVFDRAADGATRGRELFSGTKRTFDGRHVCTVAELAALYAHYEANKLASFSIAWTGPDPGTYTVFYRARPKASGGPAVFDVSVPLVEA